MALSELLTELGVGEHYAEVLAAALADLLAATRGDEVAGELQRLADDHRTLAARLDRLEMGRTVTELLHDTPTFQN
jgi:hypothetical protein